MNSKKKKKKVNAFPKTFSVRFSYRLGLLFFFFFNYPLFLKTIKNLITKQNKLMKKKKKKNFFVIDLQ